ncbi:MAG: hypothetical protein AAF125_16475, partial [Chloroflexota bacterium]
MEFRRDYSRNLFGKQRRGGGRLVLSWVLFIATFGMLVYIQHDRIEMAALEAVGMAPTATPFASEYATMGYEAFLAG